ncbi:hypothetical protein [Rhodanobacter ginsengisoli]
MMTPMKSPAGTPMTNEPLTYALIEKKIEKYARDVSDEKLGALERRAALASVGLLVSVCTAAPFVKSSVALLVLQMGIWLSVIAMLIGFVCMLRREWRTFYRRHDKLSRELDRDYDRWQVLVKEMRGFPIAELARRLRYLSARKSSLAYRTGLFTGSLQRLGVLPLLAILYLQFKDWRFGDWQAFGQVHMVGGLLLWALFLAYFLSWWLVGLGGRWDAYEALLIEATHDE